jgi:hypothetical protein
MKNSNTEGSIPIKPISKVQDQTPIAILIEDLESSAKFQEETGKILLQSLINVLEKSYLKKEREIMIKFAFDFYSELSDDMNVSENLISENRTHAEIYFDEKFNRNEAQDV